MPKKRNVTKNIGFLHSGTKQWNQDEYDEFFLYLSRAGYDANITEYWAQDDPDQLATYATALATANPPLNLIVAAGGSASAIAATDATHAADKKNPIPVVFT